MVWCAMPCPPEKDVARSSLRFFSAALDRNMLHCVPQAPHNALLRGFGLFKAVCGCLSYLPRHNLLKFLVHCSSTLHHNLLKIY